MSAKETGGPAFPCKDIIVRGERGEYTGVEVATAGLTMRDYFASKAVQGFCSDPVLLGALGRGSVTTKQVCGRAYEIADAMIKARND